MRLTLVAVGTRGDVEPMIALGAGLAHAGHHVRLATHPTFEGSVRLHGLGFSSLGTNPQDLLQRPGVSVGTGDPLRFLAATLHAFREGRHLMPRQLTAIREACGGADVIVYSPVAFPALHVAQAHGVPSVLAALQPFVATGAFPAPILPGVGRVRLPWRVAQRAYNRFTFAVVEQILWLPWRRTINRWRQDVLGLPPAPAVGFSPGRPGGPQIVLHGFSARVCPAPDDWPAWSHVCGYWFSESDPGWTPPESLRRFLAAGQAPIVVGLGSMPVGHRIATCVHEAIQTLGARAILLQGWGELGGDSAGFDTEILHIAEAPHVWLFPQARAVVHHGGAGTTAAALWAGVPAVIVPFTGDQHFWAERLHALGLAPRPLDYRRLTSGSLADTLERVCVDTDLCGRVAQIGELVREERGIERAISLIEGTTASCNKTGPFA